jgi:hypothetical protein
MTGATTLNHVQAEDKASWILMIAIAFGQAIGVAVLGGCLFVAWRLSESAGGPFGRVLQERFVIVGWVVIWRGGPPRWSSTTGCPCSVAGPSTGAWRQQRLW